METDFNIFKIKTKNLIKLFARGDISRLYEKMYSVAESIAAHETDRYTRRKLREFVRKNQSKLEASKQIDKYRQQRLNFHLNQMYRLIELRAKQSESK